MMIQCQQLPSNHVYLTPLASLIPDSLAASLSFAFDMARNAHCVPGGRLASRSQPCSHRCKCMVASPCEHTCGGVPDACPCDQHVHNNKNTEHRGGSHAGDVPTISHPSPSCGLDFHTKGVLPQSGNERLAGDYLC